MEMGHIDFVPTVRINRQTDWSSTTIINALDEPLANDLECG